MSVFMLKILVPATTQPIHMFGTGEWDSEVDSMGALSEAKTRERERVRALAALPRPLVDALPSLRYLAVADMAANPALVDDGPEELQSGIPRRAREDVIYEWDELRQIDCIREQRWWKIVQEGGERRMVQISENEGECAQRMIEENGSETTTEVEGECVSCYHLAPVG